ncbi:MAG: lauroyl acyltransferase [Alphaproteobacteria bacterium]|jgi:KDO2-lipid IV(A) lauroyltransferase|nr:lauroyl acyltransferase [Rhodospirillaceae bacterium]MDP6020920.1 lauroyl acyltransferase [Alphaproteobacteria bacterium]MDP6256315.1 lauroyl acyltransferase [Alphaproteobacteria bacterium]MDP7056749.1 lauroyl acyltransferase [Alphaproteobacteria bacterium]MDP7230664.1 lauroyl acyltransferase [Alphaproteobacteria bacterium]|tara:strand:- start:211 stop:1107 length:897 start_codon:yes stop_codon:yes gene_type:complete
MKHLVRYRLELYLARLFWALFAALPLATASGLGGTLGRLLGHVPALARRAESNLSLAMPELQPRERAGIIAGVWQNLGRTVAELPHLEAFVLTNEEPGPGQIQVVGSEKLTQHLAAGENKGQAALLFGAHLANWELMNAVTARLGHPIHVVYRAANNPLIDDWLWRIRESSALSALAKGRAAAQGILAALKRGEPVGMLVDQKMNDGIAVPFFGQPAMTAPALAQLALRQDLAVLPVHCERLAGASFRVTFMEPLSYRKSGDHSIDVTAMMGQVNEMLEDWIRERPEQWLWLHHRWPK